MTYSAKKSYIWGRLLSVQAKEGEFINSACWVLTLKYETGSVTVYTLRHLTGAVGNSTVS